jgi:transcriptional antiterminator NusG
LFEAKTSLYAVKVTTGQERNVATMLADKAKVSKLPVFAILAPAELKGYIIVEASMPHTVEELIRGMKHVRERVQGLVDPSEVNHYLETRPVVEGLEIGILVEVVAGPFKGMQAHGPCRLRPRGKRGLKIGPEDLQLHRQRGRGFGWAAHRSGARSS